MTMGIIKNLKTSPTKEKVLDFCQGARCVSFTKATLSNSLKSSDQKRSKKVNVPSVFLADTFAHDILDRFLTDRHTPTVCKFALMHRCSKASLSLPCVDEHFISAPCCMAPMYKLSRSSNSTVFEDKHLMLSCDDLKLNNNSCVMESNILPCTSTPKQCLRQTSRVIDFERQGTSSTSSGSSCTCEHHETPSGLNSHQCSDFRYPEGETESKTSKNHNSGRLAFKSNSFSEPGCSYRESLHVNTNMDHLCRKLFQPLPIKIPENEQKGSMESVVRHPSYFSDSGSGEIDTDQLNSGPNSSVFTETRSICCSPFREEEIPFASREASLEQENSRTLNKSVETQTNSSFLLQKAEMSKQKYPNLDEYREVSETICEKIGEFILDTSPKNSSFSSTSDIFILSAEENMEKINTAQLLSL